MAHVEAFMSPHRALLGQDLCLVQIRKRMLMPYHPWLPLCQLPTRVPKMAMEWIDVIT